MLHDVSVVAELLVLIDASTFNVCVSFRGTLTMLVGQQEVHVAC